MGTSKKQKKREWLRYRDFVLSPYGVIKIKSLSYNISVSVNVTVTNFAEEDLIERLQRILRTNELSIHDIEFECLETQKIVENSAALSTIKKLKDQGFMISLDDFGTGYSNLNYLKNMPAHVIKLDKSLIKDIRI
ncbi:EAL domain-containing protein [Symbiopectobacterium sp. RP]|uniref:EAL domain-containing protein n=1 Tax=Symbiopectobacterium sp. RP TaxID=3248553 RepID=UPI003D26F085